MPLPSAGSYVEIELDELIASINYALASTAYVEIMTVGGTNAVNLTGNSAAQTLNGNDAANVLNGGGGADVIKGLGGNDVLIGGTGVDTLTGGAGSDRFVFQGAGVGNDRITDFVKGTDKIDLDAYNITMANVKMSASSGNTLVAVDSDRDGLTDFTITLVGSAAPTSGDFIF